MFGGFGGIQLLGGFKLGSYVTNGRTTFANHAYEILVPLYYIRFVIGLELGVNR